MWSLQGTTVENLGSLKSFFKYIGKIGKNRMRAEKPRKQWKIDEYITNNYNSSELDFVQTELPSLIS